MFSNRHIFVSIILLCISYQNPASGVHEDDVDDAECKEKANLVAIGIFDLIYVQILPNAEGGEAHSLCLASLALLESPTFAREDLSSVLTNYIWSLPLCVLAAVAEAVRARWLSEDNMTSYCQVVRYSQ